MSDELILADHSDDCAGCEQCCQDHDHTHEHEPAHIAALLEAAEQAAAEAGVTEVQDYTGVLYQIENDALRWNAPHGVGTPVVVTYSFTDTPDLPVADENAPYDATAFWEFDQTARDLMRDVFDQFQAVSGVVFVEVDGPSMINVYGADAPGVGGWANVAYANDYEVSQGSLVAVADDFQKGAYTYQMLLHEVGHAMGLEHPFEGSVQLSDDADTQDNTVMTYNVEFPFAEDLGPFDVAALQYLYGDSSVIDTWTISVTADNMVSMESTLAADVVLATDQNTLILARAGDDLVYGRQGDDLIKGQAGSDTLFGGDGSDEILGGGGNDTIYGDLDGAWFGQADDLFGHAGNDSIYGGGGGDKLIGSTGFDYLDGGTGNDRMNGGINDDVLRGGAGNDRLVGGGGSDTFVFSWADNNGRDEIWDFRQGVDKIDVSELGMTSIYQFNIRENANGTATLLEVASMTIKLVNFDMDTLTESDFIFA